MTAGEVPCPLWIPTSVFQERGLADDVAGHVALARQCGHESVLLPVGEAAYEGMDYRRFNPSEVARAAALMPAGIIIDGPFERLAGSKGLLKVVACRNIGKVLAAQAEKVAGELGEYLKSSVKLVIIADDIAYQKGAYLSPADLRRYLFPLYRPLVEAAHNAGAQALFHSDGRISAVMSDLLALGFDGFATCQVACNPDAPAEARDRQWWSY